MRVRIIFRGLVLFRFKKQSQDPSTSVQVDGQTETLRNRGEMEVWFVSDKRHRANAPGMSSMSGMGGMRPSGGMGGPSALHSHTPRMSVYGGVRIGDDEGVKYIQTEMLLTGTTTLRLEGHRSITPGVFTTEAFDEYVPKLGDLRTDRRGGEDSSYVVAKVIVPHGVLRPRDLVSWDYQGNQPSPVAFMGTDFQGCLANEAVLEVGDDETDENTWDEDKHLSIASEVGLPSKLWPLTKGTNYVDETDPNTLEILITNFTPQRRRGVFWSLHYQSLFATVGYKPDDSYQDTPAYTNFVRAATAFDKNEWEADLDAMGLGYPFPFIATDGIRMPGLERREEKAGDIKDAKNAVRVPGTNPRSREKEPPGAAGGVAASTPGMPMPVTTNDPWSRPICPVGQDEI